MHQTFINNYPQGHVSGVMEHLMQKEQRAAKEKTQELG